MRPVLLSLVLLGAAAVPAAGEAPVEQALSRLRAKPWLQVQSLEIYPTLRADAAGVSRKLIESFPGRMEPDQIASLRLLGGLAHGGAFPFLLSLSRDRRQTAMLRRAAILGLERYADRRVVLPLLDTLRDGGPLLQQAAARTLRGWSDDALVLHRARQLMREPERDVRRHTVELLSFGKRPESAALIRRALRDPSAVVRAEAYRAAGRRRLEDALDALAQGTAARSLPERIAAVQGLAGLGRRAMGTVPALLVILADRQANPYLRATVPGALASIREPQSALEHGLRAQLDDRSPMVRRACELALAALRNQPQAQKGGRR